MLARCGSNVMQEPRKVYIVEGVNEAWNTNNTTVSLSLEYFPMLYKAEFFCIISAFSLQIDWHKLCYHHT